MRRRSRYTASTTIVNTSPAPRSWLYEAVKDCSISERQEREARRDAPMPGHSYPGTERTRASQAMEDLSLHVFQYRERTGISHASCFCPSHARPTILPVGYSTITKC